MEDARHKMEDLVTEARDRLDDAIANGREGIEEALKNSGGNAQEALEKVQKNYEELATVNRDTMEALVEANQAISRGFEDLTSQVAVYMKDQLDEGMAHAKAVSSAKSLSEFVELQTEFARKSVDNFVEEGNKLSDLALSTINGTLDPLRSHLKSTWDKLTQKD